MQGQIPILENLLGHAYRLYHPSQGPMPIGAEPEYIAPGQGAQWLINQHPSNTALMEILYRYDNGTWARNQDPGAEPLHAVAQLLETGRLMAFRVPNTETLNRHLPHARLRADAQHQWCFLPANALSGPPKPLRRFSNHGEAKAFLEQLLLTDTQRQALAALCTATERAPHNSIDWLAHRLIEPTNALEHQLVVWREPVRQKGPKPNNAESVESKPNSSSSPSLGPHEEGDVELQNDPVPTPLEARRQRYEQRKELVSQGSESPETQAAAERLDFNNDNILRAEAAEYVYRVDEYNRGVIDELPDPPVGLNLIRPEEVGLETSDFMDTSSGFGAAVLQSEISGETMLVYRGTNNGVTGKQDWMTNFGQGSGVETKQYSQAMDLARTLALQDPEIKMVGHSLGGGLASSAVSVTSRKGYTFNSAGLHPNTAGRRGGLPVSEVAKLIKSQSVRGDVLTMAQSRVTKGVLVGGAALLGGPWAALLSIVGLRKMSLMPKAVGELETLPSMEGGSPVDRHGMNQVVAGIEANKQEDIATLERS